MPVKHPPSWSLLVTHLKYGMHVLLTTLLEGCDNTGQGVEEIHQHVAYMEWFSDVMTLVRLGLVSLEQKRLGGT